MDRVHLSGSIWTFELRSWLCNTPASGQRVQFVDVRDAERTLRWLLFEDPLARAAVASLAREFGGPVWGFDGDDALIERAAELLERGLLSLYRSVEIMATEPRTREYKPVYEPPSPSEMSDINSWLFWDEVVSDHGLALEATHEGEPSFVLGEQEGPLDGFVLEVELDPDEGFALEAQLEPGEGLTLDVELDAAAGWTVEDGQLG